MSDSGGPDVTQELRLPWDDDPDDLYEHAPCGYLTTLPDGTIVKVNQTFLTWTGYARPTWSATAASGTCSAPAGRSTTRPTTRRCCACRTTCTSSPSTWSARTAGRCPPWSTRGSAATADGHPRAIRTTVFNATERRGYERELLLARRAAEESERRVRVLQQIVADLAAAPTEAEVAEAVVRAPESGLRRREQQHLPGRRRARADRRGGLDRPDHRQLGRHAAARRRARWPGWPSAATCTWSARSTEAKRALPRPGREHAPVRAATRWCCCR